MIYLNNYRSQELLIHVPIRSFSILYKLELLKFEEEFRVVREREREFSEEEDILSLILGWLDYNAEITVSI